MYLFSVIKDAATNVLAVISLFYYYTLTDPKGLTMSFFRCKQEDKDNYERKEFSPPETLCSFYTVVMEKSVKYYFNKPEVIHSPHRNAVFNNLARNLR